MNTDEFLARARCAGADPTLFDQHWFPAVYEGLAYCADCPVRLECIGYLEPARNEFTGICGGLVWRRGRRVRANHKQQVIRDRKHLYELANHVETVANLQVAAGTIQIEDTR